MTTKIYALFFTDAGAGPDSVSLWTQPVAAIVDGDEEIAPRTLGLRVGPADEFPLLFTRAGGFQMDEATVRALHERFGAWLDAPRLAAREHAEVVDEDDGVRMLKTTAGEWGVRVDDGNAPGEFSSTWFTGEDAETKARERFDGERGMTSCEVCDARVHEDDAHSTDDGWLCDACHGAAVEAFKTTRYRCPTCKWEGMGPETARDDDGVPECPIADCGDYVEEIEPAPAGEAPTP